ncbi:hypothetical protein PoB_007024200 [Plakobranchus ocellatus]|uniref:Calcineurin-like phosphoesterase domain-containing protein n=1 Tax=Plakobranchus ocellatus TaxID=259542 RepID=A0AAV4DHK2_9GAST|nr:hypothetical protein PoB_007024200 [Plakobranchus ocellatus]
MALTLSQKVLVALCVLLGFGVTHFIMVKTVHHSTKAIILRAEFVLALETILACVSVIIWRTFAPCFNTHSKFNHLRTASTMNGVPQRKSSHDDRQSFNDGSTSSKGEWSFFKVLLLVFLFLCHCSYLTNIIFISKEPYWYAMLCYICLGAYIQLVVGLIIGKIALFILHQTPLKLKRNQQDMETKVVIFIAILYSLLASMLGLYTASKPPPVRHVKIPVRDLPSNLDGLSIVQISDIHLGPTVGFTKLDMIVDIVNTQEADIVVLTGDLVDGKVQSLRSAAKPLGRVLSKYGNFFVSGNHEYYTGDVDNWFSYVRSLGFVVLHNSNVQVPAKVTGNQGQICVAGADDIQADSVGYPGHRFDVASAVNGCSESQPVILLTHQPRAAKRALDSNHKIDLVLSGHTHGGQVFPMILGAYLLNPFYLGLYQYGPAGSHVYVNEGTQYWGIPMRIGTSTEITHITLTKADHLQGEKDCSTQK